MSTSPTTPKGKLASGALTSMKKMDVIGGGPPAQRKRKKVPVESRPHGNLLKSKAKKRTELAPALAAYLEFEALATNTEVVDEAGVTTLVEAFNQYRNESVYIFESGDNVPQANLRSTMTEEFLGWLFKDVFKILGRAKPENYRIGKSKDGYLKLTFAPHSFEKMFEDPNPCISVKNQDFALGGSFQLTVTPNNLSAKQFEVEVILPVVAIECKTYLAKNHLDMCASTATDIKRVVPYCMYIIVCEFIKLVKTASPELTDISEIYVLCKAENGARKKRRTAGEGPHPIHADVVVDLFHRVIGHLRSVWWDPDTALERGKVISRPF